MSTIPTCCITGRIAGDKDACGDCDPCILGANSVPEPVKNLMAERDEWAVKCNEVMGELEELRGFMARVTLDRIDHETRERHPLISVGQQLTDAKETK